MQFLTISAAAKEIGIPQSRLRTMQAQHKLPGFYAASRYYVNLDLLKQQLETECRVNAGMVEET